jgi:hypothetical protein
MIGTTSCFGWVMPARLVIHLLYIGAIGLALASLAPAEEPRELLNSERIAAAFGSYGVEVLEQDDALRVSNLYSVADDGRTCRTFAVVQYGPVAAELEDEHAAIVAGGSIGAVLSAAGWEVRKTHLRYGRLEATARLATLMRVPPGTPLAVHVYALDVAQPSRTLEYATLVEIHHPDYLTNDDLLEIYGPAEEVARPGVAEAALATARVAASRER